MSQLTTGLIENTAVSGVRPTTNFVVRIANDDTVAATVLIEGFFVSGTTKTQYVLEPISMLPGAVVNKTYYAQFDAFEFQFDISSAAVEISAWGKNASGNLVAAHRVLPAELEPVGPTNAYGYVYNTSTQSVAAGTDVTFDTNGVLVGISHTAGTAPITISNTGDYLFTFVAGSTGAQQFDLTLGSAAVAGTTYGIGITGANYGQVITTVATAGITATLRNASASTVVLPITQGGPATTVNASLIVRKLN
ncbi:MAG: hypothetical protein ACYDEJ_01960 [Desulfitobacteriaceae bacterium]